MKKTCVECGKTLGGKQEKFCSNKCNYRYRWKKIKERHRKDSMFCSHCGKRKNSVNNQRKLCSKCFGYASKRRKKIREKYNKDPMICPYCGRRKKNSVGVLCSKCLETTNKQKKKNKERHRKDPMICPHCGRRKKYLVSILCSKCLESSRKQKRKHVNAGLCRMCGKNPIYKWSMCEKCLDKDQKRKQTEIYKEKQRKFTREKYYIMKISGNLSDAEALNTDKSITNWINKHYGVDKK